MIDWKREREEIGQRAARLRDKGLCPTCHDLETGEVYGNGTRLVYEDDLFKVMLERYPRMFGHTIVIYKPHREDISELNDEETAAVMRICLRLISALKRGLGAEKVYLNTMCDGPRNHLHLQLFPRYKGDEIGSRRFVLPRQPIENGPSSAARLRNALEQMT
jgi:histidine triad (HIT) family protein